MGYLGLILNALWKKNFKVRRFFPKFKALWVATRVRKRVLCCWSLNNSEIGIIDYNSRCLIFSSNVFVNLRKFEHMKKSLILSFKMSFWRNQRIWYCFNMQGPTHITWTAVNWKPLWNCALLPSKCHLYNERDQQSL